MIVMRVQYTKPITSMACGMRFLHESVGCGELVELVLGVMAG